MLSHPPECGIAIFSSGRIGMLRCQAIANRDRDAWRGIGQGSTDRVLALEGASDKATAMEEHQDREKAWAFGSINADGKWSAGPSNGLILDVKKVNCSGLSDLAVPRWSSNVVTLVQ